MNRHFFIYGGIAAMVVLGYVGIIFQERIWQPDSLPDFKMSQIDNPTLQMTKKNLNGKWTLLNFWASWCEVCATEVPKLNELSKKILLVGIVANDSITRVLSSTKLEDKSYINLYDKEDVLFKKLKLEGVPSSILLNPQGEIVYRVEGALEDKMMTQISRLIGKGN